MDFKDYSIESVCPAMVWYARYPEIPCFLALLRGPAWLGRRGRYQKLAVASYLRLVWVWARRYGVLSCGNVGIAVGELSCLGRWRRGFASVSVPRSWKGGRGVGLCAGFKLEIRNAGGLGMGW
jgi:hypothetical protein